MKKHGSDLQDEKFEEICSLLDADDVELSDMSYVGVNFVLNPHFNNHDNYNIQLYNQIHTCNINYSTVSQYIGSDDMLKNFVPSLIVCIHSLVQLFEMLHESPTPSADDDQKWSLEQSQFHFKKYQYEVFNVAVNTLKNWSKICVDASKEFVDAVDSLNNLVLEPLPPELYHLQPNPTNEETLKPVEPVNLSSRANADMTKRKYKWMKYTAIGGGLLLGGVCGGVGYEHSEDIISFIHEI